MLQTIPKHRLMTLLLCVVVLLTLTIPILGAYPKHTDYISDPGGLLSDTTVSAIKTGNEALSDSRGVQIAVCITDDIGDESITEFSRNLFSKWDMCDGVLLVLDTTGKTYFAVQSVDIDDTINNAVLSDLLANNMEEDFAAGNIDRAVMKTYTALSQILTDTLPDLHATTDEPAITEEEKTPEEEKPSGFVTFMKAILWLIIIVVLIAVAVFIVALFNDDVADFVRTYVFRRGPVSGSYGRGQVPHPGYYDDRLYGKQNGQRNRNGQSYPQRRPNGQQGYGNTNRGGYGGQGYNGRRPQNQNRQSYDPYNDYEAQYAPQYQYQQSGQGQRQQRRSQNGNYDRQGNPQNRQRNNGRYNNQGY